MKCFIIAAMTADGYIAKETSHGAFWTCKEDKKRFVELTKKAGVVVMGLNTFRTLPRPLKERLNVVYSPDPIVQDGVITTSLSPQDLLRELTIKGVKEVAICGGSQIYSMFLKSGVVDKIYLTIEPIIFGRGIRFLHEDMHFHLKLVSKSEAPNGALLLEYDVNYEGTPKTDTVPVGDAS